MMEFGFLFWVFLVGIVVASLQDLKRREVDNWLNLFLIVISFSFILYSGFFGGDLDLIFRACFLLVVMYVLAYLFYFGRIFAGGDAKLLFAMAMFFVGSSFYLSLLNVGIFLLLLMLSGSVYGLVYSFVLYLRDFRGVNEKMREEFGFWWVKYVFIVGMVIFLAGFFNWTLFVLGLVIFVFPFLYVFARGLEGTCMVKVVSGKDLTEGDWLESSVKVGKKTVRSSWEGLSKKDVILLRGQKEVKIKEGLPFVPAFLIAFLLYVFFKDWIINVFLGFPY